MRDDADTNKDGKLSPSELVQMAQKEAGEETAHEKADLDAHLEKEVQRHFEAMDADNNGYLNKQEIRIGFNSGELNTLPDEIVFHDTNKDGRISRSELLELTREAAEEAAERDREQKDEARHYAERQAEAAKSDLGAQK